MSSLDAILDLKYYNYKRNFLNGVNLVVEILIGVKNTSAILGFLIVAFVEDEELGLQFTVPEEGLFYPQMRRYLRRVIGG